MMHAPFGFRWPIGLLLLLLSLPAGAQEPLTDRLDQTIASYRNGERFAANAATLTELVPQLRRRDNRVDLARAQTFLGECLYEVAGREAASLAAFRAAETTVERYGLDATALPFYHRILQGLAAHYGRATPTGQAYYRRLIDFVERHRPDDRMALADGLVAQATLAFDAQQYDQGAELLRAALRVGQGTYTDWETSLLYNNLAAVYGAIYDYGRAQSAQRLASASTQDPFYRHQSQLNAASLHVDLRELTTARKQLAAVRRAIATDLPEDSQLWLLYFSTAAYLENTADDLAAFAEVMTEWAAFLDRHPHYATGDDLARYLNYRASLELRRRDYAGTDRALRRAEAHARRSSVAYALTDSRRLLRAKLADATGDFRTADSLFHQLLSEWRLTPPSGATDPHEHLPAADIYADLTSLGLVKDRAAHYARRNLTADDDRFAELATREVVVGDSLLRRLRRQYDRPGVRRQLDEVALALRRIEIGLAEFRYRSTKDLAYVETALRASEQIKYLDLSEELINDRLAREDARVRELVRARRQNAARLDSLINLLRETVSDTEGLRRIRSQIEALGTARDSLRPQLLAALDSARQQRRDEPVSLAMVRRAILTDGEALLHLVEQDSLVYLIYVDGEQADFLRVRSERAVAQRIATLLAATEAESSAVYPELRALYELFIGPVRDRLGTRDLVIVPDGALAYLPFAALIGPGTGRRYLVEDRAVRLLLSCRSRQLQNDRPQLPPTLSALAMAPFSTSGTDGWAPLRWSAKTVSQLAQRLADGRFRGYTDSTANCRTFRSLAGQANLLHIGTHAQLDDEQPRRNALLFAPLDEPTRGRLPAAEIGLMEMGADLAVLAACETMGGRLYRGRGVANLAHAFSRAGCPNLLVNLWAIRDQTAYRMLSAFYDRLYAEGLPKHRALRQAQLAYLAESNDMTDHPAYWATLVYLGDARPLRRLPRPRSRYVWIIGLLALLGGGYYWLRRRRSQQFQ